MVPLPAAVRPSLPRSLAPSLPRSLARQGDAATAAPADAADVLHFRVCHKGGVRLRSSTTDNPGPDATVLPEGTIVKARRMPIADKKKGLELVEICEGQAYSGFLPITAKGYTALEVVPGDRDEAGAWWYRVVATDGMHFAKEPKPDAPRHEAVHANGTIITAVRQVAPAGSLVMFVEVENEQGRPVRSGGVW